MTEIQSNVYLRHEDPDQHQALQKLFAIADDHADRRVEDPLQRRRALLQTAAQINAQAGEALMDALLSELERDYDEGFGSEAMSEIAGFWVMHLAHGDRGDQLVERLLRFLHELAPEAHVQAWGCGDEAPWEYWLKYEDGCLVREDDEPFQDEDADEAIKERIYRWWHASMPEAVKEGFLHEIDLAEERVVLSGRMRIAHRDAMEQYAEAMGARIQGSVDATTTLLVTGKKAAEAQLEEARRYGVRIISEAEFHELLE